MQIKNEPARKKQILAGCNRPIFNFTFIYGYENPTQGGKSCNFVALIWPAWLPFQYILWLAHAVD